MRTPKQKVIEGFTFTVTPLGAVSGSRVFARVLKMVGPLLGEKTMERGLPGLFSALNEADLDYLREAFAPMTQVRLPDGKEPVLSNIFDDFFAANYGVMVQWIFFCLEVNFGNVMSGKAAAAGQAAPGLSTSTGPKTPIG